MNLVLKSYSVTWASILMALAIAGVRAESTTQPATDPSLKAPFTVGSLLASDDFNKDLTNWSSELEKGGKVQLRDGAMEIDVPGGCTVWFSQKFDSPVMIEYDATVVGEGGPNDRVSDLNCFWMARDSRSPDDVLATKRSGKFSDYNLLKCYYVGVGGNGNTTTRFRRYIGDTEVRPLLPEHDLRDRADMITANVPQRIRLVAAGKLIQFYRDDHRMFDLNDAEPYASGWFAIRTTSNHMLVRHFRVHRLVPK